MINIILFGPPGSGKGTQAVKLAEHFGFIHISTGDLFRYEMGNNTELGLKAKDFMGKGELVPDEVTIGMLRNKVDSEPTAKGFIFDGFPRTIPQAKALDSFLAEKNAVVNKLISLSVTDDEIVQRLLERGKTSGRSDDANESVIRNRIAVYRRETEPVEGHYQKKNLAMEVRGIGTIEEVFESLKQAIQHFA